MMETMNESHIVNVCFNTYSINLIVLSDGYNYHE